MFGRAPITPRYSVYFNSKASISKEPQKFAIIMQFLATHQIKLYTQTDI